MKDEMAERNREMTEMQLQEADTAVHTFQAEVGQQNNLIATLSRQNETQRDELSSECAASRLEACSQLDDLSSSLRATQAQLAASEAEVDHQNNLIATSSRLNETQCDVQTRARLEACSQLDELTSTLLTTQAQLAAAEEKTALREQRFQQLHDEVNHLTERNKELEATQREADQTIEKLKANGATTVGDRISFGRRTLDVNRLEFEEFRKQWENDALRTSGGSGQFTKADREFLELQMAERNAEIQKLKIEIDALQSQAVANAKSTEERCGNHLREVLAYEKELQTLREGDWPKVDQLAAQIGEASQQLQAKDELLADARRELDEEKIRSDGLWQMVDSFIGKELSRENVESTQSHEIQRLTQDLEKSKFISTQVQSAELSRLQQERQAEARRLEIIDLRNQLEAFTISNDYHVNKNKELEMELQSVKERMKKAPEVGQVHDVAAVALREDNIVLRNELQRNKVTTDLLNNMLGVLGDIVQLYDGHVAGPIRDHPQAKDKRRRYA